MKKKISIIITLVILAGVSWTIYTFWWQNRGLAEAFNKELGISFKYPPEWETVNREDYYRYYPDASIVFIKPLSVASNFGIKVVDKKGLKQMNIEGSIKELDESLPEQTNGFIKISAEKIEFLGVPGFDYVFRYSVPVDFRGSMREGIQKEVVFLKDEKLYFLMFYAVPADYKQDLRDFEKVVKSFEITIRDSSNATQ